MMKEKGAKFYDEKTVNAYFIAIKWLPLSLIHTNWRKPPTGTLLDMT
jgi:hypothetical protein